MELCQPPRAVIAKPKLRVPPLSCDCHAHILGPPSQFSYVVDRSYTPPDALPEDYLLMLGTLAIQRMIVVQASCYGEDNRRAAAAVKELGVPVPIVIRMEGTNVEEGKKLLRESGMKLTTADSMDEAATKVVQLAG